MAHGREGPDIVMTIRYAGTSEIRSVSDHEANRSQDGSSAIDLSRSHLNQILHGPKMADDKPSTQQDALNAFFEKGVRRPSAQAETPYIQTVISASPAFFQLHDDEGSKKWDEVKLDKWIKETMKWLREEYGDDLAHVSLHLDETTPHMHILIIPTYERKNRKPSRRTKAGETTEEFQERLKEWQKNPEITRTAGRSSSEYWSKIWCRRDARVSYHTAVEHLGLGYGEDFVGDDAPSPEHKKTGNWVREEASRLADERLQLENDQAAFATDRADLEADQLDLLNSQYELMKASAYVETLKKALSEVLSKVAGWLKRPDLPKDAKTEAIEIAKEAHAVFLEAKKPSEDASPSL